MPKKKVPSINLLKFYYDNKQGTPAAMNWSPSKEKIADNSVLAIAYNEGFVKIYQMKGNRMDIYQIFYRKSDSNNLKVTQASRGKIHIITLG